MQTFVVVPYGSVDAGTASRIARVLDEGDQARLTSLTGDDERIQSFLAGRLALRTAAARLGHPELLISAPCPDCGLSHGRPVAVGASQPVHLALAHADGRAFAVASRAPVGIDAEPAATEQSRREAIDDLVPGRGDPLRRWTAVEAVLKADGRGLRRAPDAVRIRMFSARLDGRRYRLRTTRVDGCVATVARLQRDSEGSRG
ncbi:hypothetical protein [Leifsonia sp. fls2-241-R2A-40a]|uniref:4'-phosphopantetheinyl transferase family protein n=1 Tax=Leifsonia sp. fls2-241-R2A-40a TaxID=3040290 RepID=UPI00254CAF6E|nr:hypothetical protein [Leifsonia sp. fls2-241-R2A-40a]